MNKQINVNGKNYPIIDNTVKFSNRHTLFIHPLKDFSSAPIFETDGTKTPSGRSVPVMYQAHGATYVVTEHPYNNLRASHPSADEQYHIYTNDVNAIEGIINNSDILRQLKRNSLL